MNNIEFVDRMIDVSNIRTVYASGMFGWPITFNAINRAARQYPQYYTANRVTSLRQLVGKGYFGFDCICLIKSVIWGFAGKHNDVYGGAVYESNGLKDLTERGILTICQDVTAKMDTSDILPGEYLYMDGHAGIYVGDNKVVECTTDGNLNRVALTNFTFHKWTMRGKLPMIEYIDDEAKKEEERAAREAAERVAREAAEREAKEAEEKAKKEAAERAAREAAEKVARERENKGVDNRGRIVIGGKVRIKAYAKDLNRNVRFYNYVYTKTYSVIATDNQTYVVFGINNIATGKVSINDVVMV